MATTLSPAAIPSADGRRRGEGVIVVQTLADRIFGIVRERIVAGTLPGDRPIRQDALAAAAFLRLFARLLTQQVALEGGQQEGPKAPATGFGAGEPRLLHEVGEEGLRGVLGG